MRFFPAPRLIAVLVAAAALIPAASLRADELAEAGKLLRAGQHARALEHVDHVLAGHPNDARARFLRGLIFADQGEADAAIEVFRKLTQDFPDLPEPYNNLAVLYASRGQYEKARVSLEQSIRTHPSYATAYENLGDVYAKLASQAYDRALKLDSSNAQAQNKLALVRDLVGGTGLAEATAAEVQPKAAPPAPAPVEPAVAAAAVPAAVRSAPDVAAAALPEPSPPKATVTSAAAPAPAPAAPVATPAAAPTPVPSTAKVAAIASPANTAPKGEGFGDVLDAVDAWAQAWSRQDVDAYLAAYAKDFRPSGGQSRDAWAAQRRDRVRSPGSIRVAVDQPRVQRGPGDRAAVTFRQHYQSDRFRASSTKTLVMERAGNGAWRIVEERIER